MNKKLVYLIVGVVVAAGALLLVLNRAYSPQTSLPGPQQAAPRAQIPAAVPTIVKAVVSRTIDAKGNATGETATFNAKTDKIVYVVLTLQNVTAKTKLSYTRYLDGKYIDSKVAQPSKDGITTFYFTFEKGIGDYPKGTYTVKLYVNGSRTTSVTYVFK